MSRATSITGTVPSASCSTTTSISSRRSARGLLGVADAIDDLQALALLHERDRALGELGVGDRQQEAVLGHRSSGRVRQLVLLERRRLAGAQEREPRLLGEGLRVGHPELLVRLERERDRHDLLGVGVLLLLDAAAALELGLADVDDPRVRDHHGRLRRDAALVVARVGGDDVDEVAGADLARHAGLGVDEDGDLALAGGELGRRDQHVAPAAASPWSGRCPPRSPRASRGCAGRSAAPSAWAS